MADEELYAALAAVVTPQRLWAELDARRRELGWAWWQVAAALDTDLGALRRMRDGSVSRRLRERATAWLETSRLPTPPRP